MFRSVNRRHIVRGTTLTVALVLSTAATPPEGWAQTPAPAADTRAAIIVAAEQAKAKEVKPHERGKGEAIFKKLEEAFITGNLHWHPFFDERLCRRRLHARRRLRAARQPYNLIDVRGSLTFSRLQAGRGRVPGAAAVQPARRRCRCSAAGAKPRRSASTASARGRHRATIAPTTASRSRTCPARIEVRPTRRLFVVGGGLEVLAVEAGAGQRHGAVGRGGLHAGDPARSRRQADLPARGRDRRRSTGGTSPGYSRRGGFYGVTFHDFADHDSAFGFRRVDYEAIQHIPLLRDAWVLSFHGSRRDDLHRRRRADSVLHAAGARRRLDAARLFRAGGSATSTAC